MTNTVDALPELVKPDVIKIFEKYKVLNARELHARYEVAVETYVKTVNVEAQLMVLMANRYILPAALEYQKDVAESVAAVQGGRRIDARKRRSCSTGSRSSSTTFAVADGQARQRARASRRSAEKHAKFMRDTVVPAMAALRDAGDQIELIVPHQIWPLPTYREMLFIK